MITVYPGDLIFDIGALEGKYTDLYLKAGASHVVAVEPQGGRADLLKVKYESQPVTVVAKAVSDKIGTAKLWLTVQPWLATLNPEKWKTGRFHGYQWDNCIEVETTTLDVLIGEFGQPQFIKIDVEGCEYQVLCGLSKAVYALSFEFCGEFLGDVEKCGQRLLEIGRYEFAIGYFDQPTKTYQSLSDIMTELQTSKLPLLWGDIYARIKRHG